MTTGPPALVSSSASSIGVMGTVIALILLQVAGVALSTGWPWPPFALVDTRSTETALVRSRGATASHLGILATLEAVPVIVPAVAAAPWLGPDTGRRSRSMGPDGRQRARPHPPDRQRCPERRPRRWAGSRHQRGGARGAGRRRLRRTGLDIGIIAGATFGMWQMIRADSVTGN